MNKPPTGGDMSVQLNMRCFCNAFCESVYTEAFIVSSPEEDMFVTVLTWRDGYTRILLCAPKKESLQQVVRDLTLLTRSDEDLQDLVDRVYDNSYVAESHEFWEVNTSPDALMVKVESLSRQFAVKLRLPTFHGKCP
jgi:hypothetical protein